LKVRERSGKRKRRRGGGRKEKEDRRRREGSEKWRGGKRGRLEEQEDQGAKPRTTEYSGSHLPLYFHRLGSGI
jgi:hypothetical protein